ncbi:hypothetical protein ACQ3G6_17565 [Allorhizobium undicola]|uniref:hypothetical protein n=1 Tax=Allorhizobium undicola TaxID=78527 RepID=UPI0004808B71|nr:hypothetical protein [Allorhizobium undicola]
MLLKRFSLGILLALSLIVAGCVSSLLPDRPKKFYYDVRAVTVLAGTDVPVALVQAVERRMQAAVEATIRQDVAPRVILTVRIRDFATGRGLQKRLNEADVMVRAIYVENGATASEGNFKVQTETLDPKLAPESLAEAISARLRSLFSLTAPKV